MSIVLGYHGCNLETARKLLGGSSFAPSERPYDWLGYGSYFWEWDVVRAYEWAQARRTAQPCVVGAVIDLGNCLDLTTRQGAQAVRVAYESYLQLQTEAGMRCLKIERYPPMLRARLHCASSIKLSLTICTRVTPPPRAEPSIQSARCSLKVSRCIPVRASSKKLTSKSQ